LTNNKCKPDNVVTNQQPLGKMSLGDNIQWNETNDSVSRDTYFKQGTHTENALAEKYMEKWKQVQYVVCPSLVVIGLIGNICAIITVSQPQFRKLTTRRILCALALSDTLLLCTNPFNQSFMKDVWNQDVRALSTAGCKVFFMAYRIGKISGSWFIALVTIERFLAVMFPLKVKTLITRKTICISIAIVYIVATAVAGGWTFSSGIKDGICVPDLVETENLYIHKIFVIFGACIYSIVPICIMLILTPPVVVKIIRSHRRRKAIVHSSLERSTRETSKASIMLIAITLEYIILVTPITLVLILTIWTDRPIFGSKNPDEVVFQAVALIFEQLNHSMNFFVYVLCSQQFRQGFKDLICCRKPTRRGNSTIRLSPSSSSSQNQRIQNTEPAEQHV